ncbi:MAG: hypothetical protein QNI94_02435 [Kiloniellales bacterium]|nr:hypothetical protein [Kiloniellales bacterium]
MTGSRHHNLPPIPERHVEGATCLLDAEGSRLNALVAGATRTYPGFLIRFGDRISRRWLERTGNPYLEEIETVARRLGRPGAYFLNLSYEWSCTCAVGPDPTGDQGRLLRVLDWPFEGLGRNLVAARQRGPAGDWINLTWPGFTGSIQGLAPRRFAAAFNQAPLRRRSASMILDWGIDRVGVWRGSGLPPAHLLRQVFDQARDYAEARKRLSEAPLAMPALFSLAGPAPDQGCVIERLEHKAFVHDGPQVVANHWLGPRPRGRARGEDSEGRAALMERQAPAAGHDFAWLKPPVLNPMTRLAMVAEPASGRILAQGFEADGPATAVTAIQA